MIRLIHRSLFSLALVVVWFTLAGAQITVYTAQFKTSPIREEAEEEVRQLKARNVSAYIVKGVIPGKGVFYRVRAGVFASQGEAKKFGASLQQRGLVAEFFVTTYEKPSDDVASGAPPTSAPKTSVNVQQPQRQDRSSRTSRVTTGNLSVNAQQPSFDCTKARTRQEILICNNPYLAQLDAAMSDVYWRLHRNMDSEGANALLHAQREFLADRDRQADEEALAKVYEEWQKALEDIERDRRAMDRFAVKPGAYKDIVEHHTRAWRRAIENSRRNYSQQQLLSRRNTALPKAIENSGRSYSQQERQRPPLEATNYERELLRRYPNCESLQTRIFHWEKRKDDFLKRVKAFAARLDEHNARAGEHNARKPYIPQGQANAYNAEAETGNNTLDRINANRDTLRAELDSLNNEGNALKRELEKCQRLVDADGSPKGHVGRSNSSSGAKGLTIPTLSKHAAKQAAARGITEAQIRVAVEKGTQYADRLHGTVSHVLNEGFASGKTLVVARNPFTNTVTTVIRQTKPFNAAVKLPDGSLRYVPIP